MEEYPYSNLITINWKENRVGDFFYNILISSAFFIIIHYSGVFIRCFWYPSTLTLKIFSLFIFFT